MTRIIVATAPILTAAESVRGFKERANVAALLGDTQFTYEPGRRDTVAANDIIRTREEGFAYRVALSGATDHHVTLAGGVKLYEVGQVFSSAGNMASQANVARGAVVIPATLEAAHGVYDYKPGANLSTLDPRVIPAPGGQYVQQGAGSIYIPSMDIPTYQPSDPNKLANGDVIGTDHIYSLYNNLAAEIDGLSEITALGNDDTDTYPIRAWRWTPAPYTNQTAWKTIILTSGIHGSEMTSILGMFYMLRDLFRRGSRDPALGFIRDNVRMLIVPCVNPWGINRQQEGIANSQGTFASVSAGLAATTDGQTFVVGEYAYLNDNGSVAFIERTRKNSNAVDLNRNFNWFWSEYPDTGSGAFDYKGPSVESEAETQAMRQFFSDNRYAAAHIDFHDPGLQVALTQAFYAFPNDIDGGRHDIMGLVEKLHRPGDRSSLPYANGRPAISSFSGGFYGMLGGNLEHSPFSVISDVSERYNSASIRAAARMVGNYLVEIARGRNSRIQRPQFFTRKNGPVVSGSTGVYQTLGDVIFNAAGDGSIRFSTTVVLENTGTGAVSVDVRPRFGFGASPTDGPFTITGFEDYRHTVIIPEGASMPITIISSHEVYRYTRTVRYALEVRFDDGGEITVRSTSTLAECTPGLAYPAQQRNL